MQTSSNNIHAEKRVIAIVTIEEVTRLTGKAASAAPAVCAWHWTGQAQAPAPVLIGALRAMPATLVSETAKTVKNHLHAMQVIIFMDWL